MSTIAYAALTQHRQQQATGLGSQVPPPLKVYIDAMAALVPAEVLALHAAIVPLATETKGGATTITDAGTLQWVFWALVALSVLLYVVGRIPKVSGTSVPWGNWDYARIAMPPFAFAFWTMLQKVTAFDAAFPGVPEPRRYAIALIGAAVVAIIAAKLP